MKETHPTSNADAIWDTYATSFSRITTGFQSALYREVAALATDSVIDFGCGSAKLAPYLATQPALARYLGIDACPRMVTLAHELLARLADPRFSITCSTIEEIDQSGFHFGVSINSYYAWRQPADVLQKIGTCLTEGATFILATPNPDLDMAGLMQDSNKDFLLNPDFDQFRQCNDQLARLGDPQFVTMDTLIGQLRDAGFGIRHCHSQYFAGGLNYIHAENGRRNRH